MGGGRGGGVVGVGVVWVVVGVAVLLVSGESVTPRLLSRWRH